jgi:hypothetical protein
MASSTDDEAFSDESFWEDYSSEFYFDGSTCTCPADDEGVPIHESVDHGYGGCEGTLEDGSECPCEAYWEHT